MIVFDTDGWAAQDRVERWREEFGRSVIRAEVSAQGEKPQNFGVRMALLGGAQLTSLDMRLRSLRKVRDRRWFGDGADDLTFMLCVAGTVKFDTNGERRILRRGEAALFSHIVPVDLLWDEARIVTLQISRAALVGLPDPDRLAGRILTRDLSAYSLLRVYLTELWRQGVPLAPFAERHLVELIVEALSGAPPVSRPSEARAVPRLAAARAFISAHAREDLRIEQLARTIGASVRTIERDFASAGTSFADELTSARLSLVLTLLAGNQRIGNIAFAAGFNDLSSFNRRFKQKFGCTPTEERQARYDKAKDNQ